MGFSWDDENVLELGVMVAYYEYTKCHWTVYFKMVNFDICAFLLK